MCGPTKAFGTYIPHREFRARLQFYCQVPLFEPSTRCPRRKFGAVMDVFGDHLLHSEHESYRIWRHDAQVHLLASDISKAARHPIVEPRPKEEHRQRPDIKALGSHGGTTLFDVTISHPLSSDGCVREGPKYFVSASCRSPGYEQRIMPSLRVRDQCII